MRDYKRCGRSKEVIIAKFIGQGVSVRVTLLKFLESSGVDS